MESSKEKNAFLMMMMAIFTTLMGGFGHTAHHTFDLRFFTQGIIFSLWASSIILAILSVILWQENTRVSPYKSLSEKLKTMIAAIAMAAGLTITVGMGICALFVLFVWNFYSTIDEIIIVAIFGGLPVLLGLLLFYLGKKWSPYAKKAHPDPTAHQ